MDYGNAKVTQHAPKKCLQTVEVGHYTEEKQKCDFHPSKCEDNFYGDWLGIFM